MKNIISYKNYINESKYIERVLIYLDISNSSCYFKSKFYDTELNSKLINIILEKLDITNAGKLGKYKIPNNKLEDVIKILERLNLAKSIVEGDIKRLVFKGTISIKDIKKIKIK